MDNDVDDRVAPTVLRDPSPGHGHKRQQALLRVARRSAAESDPDKVLHVLLSEAQQLLDATGGMVARWDEERQVLVNTWSTTPNAERIVAIALGQGASGRAA